jgi:hydrogenase nickel incorporation protein HypB
MEIKVLKDILGANEQIARRNRELFDRSRLLAVNLMASPGAGKTSLLLQTIKALKGRASPGVIEADVASSLDAEAIDKQGVPVVQINTGGECHLEAGMMTPALDNLPLEGIDLLFIENIGNLICTAEFNLGEHRRVLVASVPEGDDKPYKYPLMFHTADMVLLNKIDLLPYVNFNVEAFSVQVKAMNERTGVIPISCTTGQGIEEWVSWLLAQMGHHV